jgi:ABC-type Zn uptake system ZnuABC Zn-binding protein ZnuA
MALVTVQHVAAADKLKVVTTIPDLADMTRQVGGDYVDVTSLATGVSRTSMPCR